MANDPLADALNSIKTHEMFSKPAWGIKTFPEAVIFCLSLNAEAAAVN